MVIGSVIRAVVGAVFGAIFGAVFGYLIGWLVNLFFPSFTISLMSGLHGVTGVGGIDLAQLLAAIGFIVGVLSGIVSGFTHRHWWDH
jgi:hypothetical protein